MPIGALIGPPVSASNEHSTEDEKLIIQYTLTMPNNNSWDGKWSGEGNLYAIVKSYRSQPQIRQILEKDYHHYNFGDGWAAGISIKEIDASEARKVRKKSRGFCGYDWMVRSNRNVRNNSQRCCVTAHSTEGKDMNGDPKTLTLRDARRISDALKMAAAKTACRALWNGLKATRQIKAGAA